MGWWDRLELFSSVLIFLLSSSSVESFSDLMLQSGFFNKEMCAFFEVLFLNFGLNLSCGLSGKYLQSYNEAVTQQELVTHFCCNSAATQM